MITGNRIYFLPQEMTRILRTEHSTILKNISNFAKILRSRHYTVGPPKSYVTHAKVTETKQQVRWPVISARVTCYTKHFQNQSNFAHICSHV